MIDITELSAEDRQKFMWRAPLYVLKDILERLMKDGRQSELGARLDALTIYTLRK